MGVNCRCCAVRPQSNASHNRGSLRVQASPLSLSAILSFRITDAANLVVASQSIWPLSMVGTTVLELVLTPVAISRAVLSSTNRTHSNRTWRTFSSIPEPQDGLRHSCRVRTSSGTTGSIRDHSGSGSGRSPPARASFPAKDLRRE